VKLTKFIAVLAVFVAQIDLQIGSFMLGWGMEPRSWWWIFGLGLCGNAFFHLVARHVLEEIKEPKP